MNSFNFFIKIVQIYCQFVKILTGVCLISFGTKVAHIKAKTVCYWAHTSYHQTFFNLPIKQVIYHHKSTMREGLAHWRRWCYITDYGRLCIAILDYIAIHVVSIIAFFTHQLQLQPTFACLVLWIP